MNDFDFYTGTWDVVNRRLRERLTGCTEWDEFPGVSVARSIFGGAGNMDEIDFPTRGFAGLTLRLYDPEREEWSLYWSSSRSTVIEPAVVGRFHGGVGLFYCDDTHEGTPVRVRFVWSGITATTARWEQAFSVDGEKTWETNWIMESTRRAD
ncbi:hypothetical protein [Sphaerisporangium sp. TRM90804]|uniref:hypothetical protein n=1 Tax=Sphaerisporangium sp. TRM90804 TaxID=3031113 RepID=UPI0024487406|nr:hypothetical protein [Sphaerisporangium sp. TRM90804]MDH2426575.1 hypothetical protein [Sphaerisporangium sp. TRM90804]